MTDRSSSEQSIRAIPRQIAAGIVYLFAILFVAASLLTRLLPAGHAPQAGGAPPPLPERIAPVARVEIVAAPAAAEPTATTAATTPEPVPAVAPPPVPAPVPTPAPVPVPAAAPAPVAAGEPAPAAAAAAKKAVPPAPPATKAELPPPRSVGRDVYQKTCATCHATGVAGAPKTGDLAAWGPRIIRGSDSMLANALNGKGAMPPRGGNPSLSDAEVRAALEYMLGQFN